ncbi:MAG: hypothetical protein ACXVLZ_06185 [Acidimicrobiia bacterium]
MAATSALSSVPENRSPVKWASTVSSLTTTSATRKPRIASRNGFGETGVLPATALPSTFARSVGVPSAAASALSRLVICTWSEMASEDPAGTWASSCCSVVRRARIGVTMSETFCSPTLVTSSTSWAPAALPRRSASARFGPVAFTSRKPRSPAGEAEMRDAASERVRFSLLRRITPVRYGAVSTNLA